MPLQHNCRYCGELFTRLTGHDHFCSDACADSHVYRIFNTDYYDLGPDELYDENEDHDDCDDCEDD